MLIRTTDASPDLAWEAPLSFTPLLPQGPGNPIAIAQDELPIVSIGRPDTWRVADLYGARTLPRAIRTKLKDNEFLLLRLYCSLRPRKNPIVTATFRIALSRTSPIFGQFGAEVDPDRQRGLRESRSAPLIEATLFDMHPMTVVTPVHRTMTISLNPTLKFHEVEAGIGAATFGFQYDWLEPSVTAAGLGESFGDWKFQRTPSVPLQGAKWMHAVVKAPRSKSDQPSLRARVSFIATVERGWLFKEKWTLDPVSLDVDLKQ